MGCRLKLGDEGVGWGLEGNFVAVGEGVEDFVASGVFGVGGEPEVVRIEVGEIVDIDCVGVDDTIGFAGF